MQSRTRRCVLPMTSQRPSPITMSENDSSMQNGSLSSHGRNTNRFRTNQLGLRACLGILLLHTCAAFVWTSSPPPRSVFSSSSRHDRRPVHRLVVPFFHQTSSARLNTHTILYASTDQPADDDSEWNAVIAALKLYKAAYGDVKVPQRFIVPNMAPWPEQSWGLKLGKSVASIRQTGKFLHGTSEEEERRQALEDLGFVWRARQEVSTEASDPLPLEQLYLALRAYREINVPDMDKDKWSVPSNFHIPDLDPWPDTVRGLPLGQELGNLKRRLSRNKNAKERFQALGLEMLREEEEEASTQELSANDVRFQNVYAALKTYKEMYGDLLVPQPFTVPKTTEWPKETWGLRLGARVNAIRSQGTFINNNPERRKMLDDLDFVWTTPKERARRGRKSKSEFSGEREEEEDDEERESASNGADDSLFDESFDFGKDFDFSEEGEKTAPTWGLVEGGSSELQEAMMKQEESTKQEEEYAEPRSLDESLAEASQRAIEVGVIEGLTERKRVVKGKQEKYIPWFNDDFGEDFVFDDVVEALTIYKSMYGDFSNFTGDNEFVIPAPVVVSGFLDDDDDDFSFGAFDADASARAAAAIASFEEQGDLESSEKLIAAEIQRLQSEVGRPAKEMEIDTKVATPKKSKAPSSEWPEHLAGMPLGSIVTRIKDGSLEVKHLPERKAKLDAIGFDWGDPLYFIDIPFEKAMCAMYAYYLIRGDMFVWEDFVMPDEDPWPQALAGYEIGKAVKRIRELQNFLEAYHPEKVSLLRMIDFVWFPTMALPLDPNETEMNSEMLLLSAMGHPDYAKMIDIPMGLPDKIVADGPFFETDDPKLWWRKWHNWDYVKDYWYQQGRRDNAFVLRKMGYPQMADEHEAKYGPGLFQQISETLDAMDGGAFDDASLEEKRTVLEKLNFFRTEMIGCTDIHPADRSELIADLDERMLLIMKNTDLRLEEEEDDIEVGEEDEYDESEYDEDAELESEEDYDDIEVDDFEINLDDELDLQ